MLKKFVALVVLLLMITAATCAETPDLSEVTGFWMNGDVGLVLLEIHEDGSGSIMDAVDRMGVPLQVKKSSDDQYGYTICLVGEEFASDLSFQVEDDKLIMYSDDGEPICFVRDYCEGMPAAYIMHHLSIRYEPEAFSLTYDEYGALQMNCKYSEDPRDYIHISLVKDTDMATLLEGLTLQSGKDDVFLNYGCWDFEEDEAGSIEYIANENGTDFDYFFMVIPYGQNCYLVESHYEVKEEFDESSLTDLFNETLGSIMILGEK